MGNKAIAIVCPKCKQERGFLEYKLEEAATLVCPNCGAEFSLTATVEKLPGGEEETPPDFEPDLSEPEMPAELPAAAELPPPEGMPAPVTASAQRNRGKRQPVISVGVLACSECKADWIGTHTERCPNCGASTVLASQKTVSQRAEDTRDEVERGVPVERAAAKLVGHFHERGAK